MEGMFAIMAVFGMPVLIIWIRARARIREKELALEELRVRNPKLLTAATEEKRLLEERVRNLESIVCSVDYELNQRLNKLAASASIAAKVKALSDGAAGAAPGQTLAPNEWPDRDLVPAALGVLVPGQVVLGRYTVEREIGRGGMGAVYLAHDAKLGERVALKTISSALAGDPAEMVDRFRREVQAARRVTHGNVIRIHDLGEDGSLLFLSMEYVDGETLASVVKREGSMDVEHAREVMLAVSSGVAAAHAAGVVHRDLKPANVLITRGSRAVKVIDFGLARASYMTGMTATGMIMGTPEYMAPEQIRGTRTDARTDVYALGAMMYCLLCGRAPFGGDSAIAIGFATVHDPAPSPRETRPEIPAVLEAAILRALEKDPARRFKDAEDWRKAISA